MSAIINGGAVVNGGGGGGASLPTTPALALLDAGNPSTLVGLDGSGEGTALSYAAAAALLGVSAPVTYYASDFAAEQGGVSGGAAAITGTGASSTATLTVAGTAGPYGTSGSTAPRIVLTIPAGARMIEATVQTTATSGTGDNWRYLGFALRNTPNGGAPTSLWGLGYQTLLSGGSAYPGGLMAGANDGIGAVGIYTGTNVFAADRWLRLSWRPTETYFAFLTGAGTAGARPTVWYPPATAALPVHASGKLSVGDTEGALGLAVFFQSFGGSGTLTYTFKITVRVVSEP